MSTPSFGYQKQLSPIQAQVEQPRSFLSTHSTTLQKYLTKHVLIASLLMGGAVSQAFAAACNWGGSTFVLSFPSVINIPATGGSEVVARGTGTLSVVCDGLSSLKIDLLALGGGTVDFPQVYPAPSGGPGQPLDGLGMRLTITGINSNLYDSRSGGAPMSAHVGSYFMGSATGAPFGDTTRRVFRGNVTVELVKLWDKPNSGIVNFVREEGFAAFIVRIKRNQQMFEGEETQVFGFPRMTINVQQACTVNAPAITVQMNKVSAEQVLRGTAPTTNFQLGISCPVGTTMLITANDSSNSGNRSNILSLTNASTARGVGIQLSRINEGQIIAFGNGWQAAGGSSSIPLAARYVSNGEGRVLAGSANGIATFTINYQ